MKHTLTLTRGSDASALYRNATAADGKVDITNISWHMPQIQMTPEYLTGIAKYYRTEDNTTSCIQSKDQ